MGNKLNQHPYNCTINFQAPIKSQAQVFIKWSKQQILQIYQKYIALNYGLGFFVSKANLLLMIQGTRAESLQHPIIKLFGTSGRSNLLQFFSVVIIYSATDLSEKINLILYSFDFDGNNKLTKDEMTILLTALLRGISLITSQTPPNSRNIAHISEQLFKAVDSNPDGKLEYIEVFNWVQSNPSIQNFLQAPPFVIKSRTKSSMLPELSKRTATIVRNRRRDANSTFDSSSKYKPRPRKLFIVDSQGKHYTKDGVMKLKRFFELEDKKNTGAVVINSLIRRFSKLSGYQSISASLQEYKKKLMSDFPSISFRELLSISFPSLNNFQLNSMLVWTKFKGEYFPEMKQRKTKKGGKLTFKTARNLRFVFNRLDQNKDGYVEFDELKMGYPNRFDTRCLEDIFNEYDLDHNRRLNFEEFVKMITPVNTTIDPSVLSFISN